MRGAAVACHRVGMNVRRVVPDFHAEDPAASAEFYAEVLGLEVAMDHGWIITFAAPGNPAAWDITTVSGAAFARYAREAGDYMIGRRTAEG